MSKLNRKTLTQQIADTEKRVSQEKARLKQLAAKQTAAQRKADTQKKIVVGAVVLKKCESNAEIKAAVWDWLHHSLFDNRDRAAFDLPLTETLARQAESSNQDGVA